MKKTLKAICIMLLLQALVCTVFADAVFSDVAEDAWYAESVKKAKAYGYMNGVSETLFSPEANFTVAEGITVAARLNAGAKGEKTDFVSTGANWYDAYVSYATENGIISSGQFDSYDRNMTRAEMAGIMVKALPA